MPKTLQLISRRRCVLGEMYNRLPILQGETDRDQLFKIFGRLGRPTEDNFPGWRSLPGFPESKGYPWDKVPEDQPLLQVTRKWKYVKPISISPTQSKDTSSQMVVWTEVVRTS